MNEVELGDDELLLRSGGENPAAFRVLVERHSKAVLRYLVRRTGDHFLAEDLLQESFLRAYGARDGWRAQGTVSAWLLAIARNLLIVELRRLRRWRSEFLGEESGASCSGFAGMEGTPEAIVITRERHDEVRRELLRLPSRHREVLLLSRYGGLRYAEIAVLIGITEARVRQRVYNAKQSLKRRLSGL